MHVCFQCVCVFERKRMSLCVCERERMCVCVSCECERERDGECVSPFWTAEKDLQLSQALSRDTRRQSADLILTTSPPTNEQALITDRVKLLTDS